MPAKARWKFLPASTFPDYAHSWDGINAQGFNSPLLRSEFIRPLLKYFGNGEEILAILEQANRPVAMTILTRTRSCAWQTFQPSQCPVGAWVSLPDAPITEILRSLLSSAPGFTLSFGLSQQDPDLLTRPHHHNAFRTLDYIQTAKITVKGDFERYWSERGKNLRHTTKRLGNRLEREGIVTRLEHLTHAEEVALALNDYTRLESTGWKAKAGTAVLEDNVQGRFYRELLENFSERGEGHIYRYWYGDSIVAMDLCISGTGSLIILKTAYDESHNTTSPATLMHQEIFKRIFDEQAFTVIEFYGRVMDWHLRWTDEVRTMYHLNVFRWPLLARLWDWKNKSVDDINQPRP